MSEPARIDDALASLRATLAADGYDLAWSDGDDAVDVEIAAGVEACEDCLAPRPVLESILSTALADAGARLGELRLPA